LLFINGLTPRDDGTNARAETIQHADLWHNTMECLGCTPEKSSSVINRVATLTMPLLDSQFR